MADDKETQKIAKSIMIGKSVNESVKEITIKYRKPATYTGNRKLFDSGKAKCEIKKLAFQNGEVKDPYTGKILCLKRKDAIRKFGKKKWTEHLAEADHIHPLKKVYEENKDNIWNTSEDIQQVANDKDNLEVVSRKFNNAKRDKTNEKLIDDEPYLRDKNLEIEDKSKCITKGKVAEEKINEKLSVKALKNCTTEFHNAGVKAAKSSGGVTLTVSGISNIIAVIKGEKTPNEALKDVSKDSAVAIVEGYVIGGGTTIVTHQLRSMLTKSTSPFLNGLNKANLPVAVVTAVMTTADVVIRYINGEITASECILQLGERGTNIMISSYSAAVGQALIPIPFVGAAVGAMVGSVLTTCYYKKLRSAAEAAHLAKEKYERIKEETDAAIQLINKEREEFEQVTQRLFKERAEVINAGFKDITKALMDNDFELMASGLEHITNSFGRNIGCKTFAEFDEQMRDKNTIFEL